MLNRRMVEKYNIQERKAGKSFVTGLAVFASILAVGMSGCSGAPSEGSTDTQQSAAEKQQSVSDGILGKEDVLTAMDGTLTVQFLDVGQGNAVLAECDGHYMLIDGGAGSASSYVVSFLKNQGVETLDYVVVSHYDDDHLNGVVGALHVFDCGTVLAPDYETDTKIYDSFLSVLDEDELTPIYPEVGATYELGDALFTVVCPDNYDYKDENDNSVGIRLTYGGTSFLICGDASEESEASMVESGIDLQSDVYLASHHGSSGASTEEFLQQVQPKAVVISAGYDNSYGHPSKAALERIRKTGADLYRTDLQGELKAVSDGTNISWNVEPSNDFRSGDEIISDGETQKGDGQGSASQPSDTQPSTVTQSGEITYIINTNSGKFHLPDCSSVDDMSEANKKETTESRAELEAQGFSPCKRCLE